MNRKKSIPHRLLTALLFVSLVSLMAQVFAQKEIKPATSSNIPAHQKYLELKPDQLNILGFESNPDGLFYKNVRVDRTDKSVLCLYFTEKTYCTSIILKQDEAMTGHSTAEKILQKQKPTENDFYPVVVAGYNGSRTSDLTASQKNPNQKLLPVQFNMAELKLGKRNDTLVFWFRPTEALKETLRGIVDADVDSYIQALPAKK